MVKVGKRSHMVLVGVRTLVLLRFSQVEHMLRTQHMAHRLFPTSNLAEPHHTFEGTRRHNPSLHEILPAACTCGVFVRVHALCHRKPSQRAVVSQVEFSTASWVMLQCGHLYQSTSGMCLLLLFLSFCQS